MSKDLEWKFLNYILFTLMWLFLRFPCHFLGAVRSAPAFNPWWFCYTSSHILHTTGTVSYCACMKIEHFEKYCNLSVIHTLCIHYTNAAANLSSGYSKYAKVARVYYFCTIIALRTSLCMREHSVGCINTCMGLINFLGNFLFWII